MPLTIGTPGDVSGSPWEKDQVSGESLDCRWNRILRDEGFIPLDELNRRVRSRRRIKASTGRK